MYEIPFIEHVALNNEGKFGENILCSAKPRITWLMKLTKAKALVLAFLFLL